MVTLPRRPYLLSPEGRGAVEDVQVEDVQVEEIRNPDPLHAMPFRWAQAGPLEFRKSNIARLLVHACSLQFASVQNIC